MPPTSEPSTHHTKVLKRLFTPCDALGPRPFRLLLRPRVKQAELKGSSILGPTCLVVTTSNGFLDWPTRRLPAGIEKLWNSCLRYTSHANFVGLDATFTLKSTYRSNFNIASSLCTANQCEAACLITLQPCLLAAWW